MDSKADPNMQGGGARGGPRRWTGAGPRPARHIPWPELFKHHESVLTGHLKMMDMVRKHCVEGTGNHTTAQSCVDRTREMLKMFKRATWNFVPPKDSIDRVPVGASSASMYPGYSPADHIYGEAAREFGHHAAEMKRNGLELDVDPEGPQYEIGQRGKAKRKHEAEEGPTQAATPGTEDLKSREAEEDHPMNGAGPVDDGSQYFVIDTKPTPRQDLHSVSAETKPPKKKSKRKVSFDDEYVDGAATNGIPTNNLHTERHVADRSRSTAQKKSPATAAQGVSQVQDITAEVEARLKAKEERKKRRAQKKRPREDSDLVVEGQADNSSISEKPKRKKAKHARQAPVSEDKAEAQSGGEGEVKTKSSKKDRKRSSKKRAAADEDALPKSASNENEESRMKRKRV